MLKAAPSLAEAVERSVALAREREAAERLLEDLRWSREVDRAYGAVLRQARSPGGLVDGRVEVALRSRFPLEDHPYRLQEALGRRIAADHGLGCCSVRVERLLQR